MEINEQKPTAEQLQSNLPASSIRTLQKPNSESLSVYSGNLTIEGIIEQFAKIKLAFPSLPEGFYEILSDRVKGNNFTDERLKDSVNHLIDNCNYPTPTISQLISWDKKIKLFSYDDVCEFIKNGHSFASFVSTNIGYNFPVWVKKIDFETYHLTKWEGAIK